MPRERVLLVTNDIDIYAFDVKKRAFTAVGDEVVNRYMPGFPDFVIDRHGVNRAGDFQELPRSDLKSFSLAPDGSIVYVQSLWQWYRGNNTNVFVNGSKYDLNVGDNIYRSRWFYDVPGWPKPKT